MTLDVLLGLGVALPLALGLGLGSVRPADTRFLGTAAVIAFVASRWLAVGEPRLPPVEALDWPVPLAVAGLVATWAGGAGQLVSMGMGVWALTAMLQPRMQHGWSPDEGMMRGLAAAASVSVIWTALHRTSTTLSTREFAPGLALLAGATAVALGATGSVELARTAGMLAAAKGGVAFAAFRLDHTDARPLVDTFALPWLALVGGGVLYSELPVWAAVAILVSPLCFGFGRGRGAVAGMVAGGGLATLVAAYLVLSQTGETAQPY